MDTHDGCQVGHLSPLQPPATPLSATCHAPLHHLPHPFPPPATPPSTTCHSPLCYLPRPTPPPATPLSTTCHSPFNHLPLPSPLLATSHSTTCHAPLHHLPRPFQPPATPHSTTSATGPPTEPSSLSCHAVLMTLWAGSVLSHPTPYLCPTLPPSPPLLACSTLELPVM